MKAEARETTNSSTRPLRFVEKLISDLNNRKCDNSAYIDSDSDRKTSNKDVDINVWKVSEWYGLFLPSNRTYSTYSRVLHELRTVSL